MPLIIGNHRINEFNLKGGSIYNSSVDPSIMASFSTAAFRFGHSMSNGIFQKINPLTSKVAKNVNLSDTLFITNEYKGTGTDMILAGLCNLPARSLDSFGSTQLRNLTFKHSSDMDVSIPRFGKDLFAINIARGRDHGIPSYAQFYEKFGPITDFNRSMKCWLTRPKSFNIKSAFSISDDRSSTSATSPGSKFKSISSIFVLLKKYKYFFNHKSLFNFTDAPQLLSFFAHI